jgi:hypothetical protein
MDYEIRDAFDKKLKDLQHGDKFMLVGGATAFIRVVQREINDHSLNLEGGECLCFNLTDCRLSVLGGDIQVIPLEQSQQAIFKRI